MQVQRILQVTLHHKIKQLTNQPIVITLNYTIVKSILHLTIITKN